MLRNKNSRAPTTPVTSVEFYRRPLPGHCVAFSSREGRALFREALLAGHMEAYFGLAAQLCTQAEPAYCGLATLVMILNALEMDPGRVWKGPWRWYHENMLTCCADSNILTEGIVMDKFADMARCNGLNVEMHRVHPTSQLTDFRNLVIEMTSSNHVGYLVSCYDRGAIGQTGTGHFAAIGGYHPQNELVFLFETARFKYPPHWVPLALLWEGMSRVDPATQQPRGYLVLTRATALQLKSKMNTCPLQDVTLSFPPNETKLLLFDISHSTWQAFMSPIAISDKSSVGYRLRQVAESWMNWLQSPTSPDASNCGTLLIKEAACFLLETCALYNPGNFFLTIQPCDQSSTSTEDCERQLLQDLLSSYVGRTVAELIAELPKDRLNLLTRDSGTFRLAISRGFGTGALSSPTCNIQCPFVELTDAGMRLTVFITSFLIFSPRCYGNVCSSQPSISESTTRQKLLIDLTKEMELSDIARSELNSLQILFCFLLRSALSLDDEAVLHCRQWGKRCSERS